MFDMVYHLVLRLQASDNRLAAEYIEDRDRLDAYVLTSYEIYVERMIFQVLDLEYERQLTIELWEEVEEARVNQFSEVEKIRNGKKEITL